MSSFFQAEGGGLAEMHPGYIRRQNLDDKAFREAIRGRLFRTVAPRQLGKTSLLRHLRERLREQGWRCVIVNLSTLLNLSMAAWYEELGYQLTAELTPGLPLRLSNHLNLFTYLTGEAMDARYGAPRVAVFFDAVENVCSVFDEQGKSFSDAFFSTIRSYYDNNPDKNNLTIGLASAVSPRYLIKDGRISPFNIGLQLDIDDFTPAETRMFTSYLEQGQVPIEESAHDEIYAWTHGHPYLTNCICAELAQQVSDQHLEAVSAESVRQVVRALFFSVRNPQQQNSNLRHANRVLSHLDQPVKSVWEQIRRGQPRLAGSVDSDTLDDFYMTGVIVRDQNDHLVIRNQIYREVFQVVEPAEPFGVAQAQTATEEDMKGEKMSNKRMSQAQETSKTPVAPNPWRSGMFYLVAFVVVVAVLFGAVRYLPWYSVPLLLVGAIVALMVISSFGLVGWLIPVKNFMELMRMVFKFLPSLLHGDDPQPDPDKK